MGRGKQSLTAPLQGECPGQRGCKRVARPQAVSVLPLYIQPRYWQRPRRDAVKGGRRPFILTLDGEGADTLNPAGGGYRPPLAPFRAGIMGQGTGPLCTAGGSPGWVRHWEQSDLCRGQRPAAAAATAPGRARLPTLGAGTAWASSVTSPAPRQHHEDHARLLPCVWVY